MKENLSPSPGPFMLCDEWMIFCDRLMNTFCLLLVSTGVAVMAHASPALSWAGLERLPVDRDATVDATQAALDRTVDQLSKRGGGLLLLPPDIGPRASRLTNSRQGVWRDPPPPAPARGWGAEPGVTVFGFSSGTPVILPPQVTGMEIFRTLKLPEGQSLPHWDYQPMLRFHNAVLRGSNSYRDGLQEDVQTGASRRFYVRTVRGLFPGLFLNTGDYSNIQRLYVQDLGYDREKGSWYFTADATADVPKGTLLHNKNHTNVIRMDTHSHNENQTFDVMLWRHHYSQGDAYLFDARFHYMGDVHSTNGDENGVVYAAFAESLTAIFRGVVEKWDPASGALRYRDARNSHSLASGRPLINLNPDKWITGGTLWVLPPGGARLGWGSGIQARGAHWTDDVIGRYFTIDEPGEYVPGGDTVRRWWLITSLRSGDNGIQTIGIQRHWWGARDGHSIGRLYRPDHYSHDAANPRPLRYIIAPGANVFDASDGVESPHVNTAGSRRLLRLAPGPQRHRSADFAPGDPIEQAIGPDPFAPIAFRAWLWDSVPGVFPAPVFDVANHGVVKRDAVLSVRGGSGDLVRDRAERADRSTPWNRLIEFSSAANHGIHFRADTALAAILFEQPHAAAGRLHTLRWQAAIPRTIQLAETGTFAITGNAPLNLDQAPVSQVQALSATAQPASNLRGIAQPIPPAASRFEVVFPTPEPDAAYAILAAPSWPTASTLQARSTNGFTLLFESPAPAGACFDWVLTR